MKLLTREWVKKAEGDFITARREIRARKLPNYDSACFHAQQCAEKYLKARLQEASAAFPLTHDLEVLVRLLLPIEPQWIQMLPSALLLTQHAVKTRYPGASVTGAQARDAVARATEIRKLVRASLGLRR